MQLPSYTTNFCFRMKYYIDTLDFELYYIRRAEMYLYMSLIKEIELNIVFCSNHMCLCMLCYSWMVGKGTNKRALFRWCIHGICRNLRGKNDTTVDANILFLCSVFNYRPPRLQFLSLPNATWCVYFQKSNQWSLHHTKKMNFWYHFSVSFSGCFLHLLIN